MANTENFKLNTKPAQDSLQALINMLMQTARAAGMSEQQIKEMVDETKRASTEGVKNVSSLKNSMGGLQSTAKQVGGILVAAFALDRIKSFASEVIKVTAEFQKLEAVLTNTLGSKSEALRTMKSLQDIAAKTPFSVLQLTQSYVKLVNQGIKPTNEQIIKLGDLASSTGKEFDQLTEAIIDAQTGEFERLKEFGIRASKQGDQVVFTFKGVQTQVDFTAQSIQDYIFALGEAEGVTGSMAAISATLGGQLSNAGDSWNNFLNTLGTGNNETISAVVFAMNALINVMNEYLETSEQAVQGEAAKTVDLFKIFAEGQKDINVAMDDFLKLKRLKLDLETKEYNQLLKSNDVSQQEYDAKLRGIEVLKAEILGVTEYVRVLQKDEAQRKASKAAQDAAKKAKEDHAKVQKEWVGIDELAVEAIKKENKALAETEALIKRMIGEVPGLQELVDSIVLPDPETSTSTDSIIKGIEARKEAMKSFKEYSIAAANEILRAEVVNTQVELAMLENKYRTDMEFAGDNEKAKDHAAKKYQREKARLLQQQAEQEQQAALFNIAVSQGPAIAKTAQALGFPLAIPFLVAVAALFATQISNTKNLSMPRFAATGDFDIAGTGTETSDSNPYMLSVHESVVHARGTKKFRDVLRPMIEDKNFDWWDLRNIVDQKIPSGLPGVMHRKAIGADTGELAAEMRKTRKAIESKKETRFEFDENGFRQWVGKAGSWESYVKSRYSSKG